MYWYKIKEGYDSYVDLGKAKKFSIEKKNDSFRIIAEFSLSVDSNEDVTIGTFASMGEAQEELNYIIYKLNGIVEESEEQED